MDALRELFVNFVDVGFLKQLTVADIDLGFGNEKSLGDEMRECLRKMAAFESAGYAFSHSAYSMSVREKILGNPNGRAMVDIFRGYCHFEDRVLMMEDFPDIKDCLYMAGLTSWARLRVDRSTLRPFSLSVVKQLETIIMNGGELRSGSGPEAADLIQTISRIFDIGLSLELQDVIDWHLYKDIKEPDDDASCSRVVMH